MHIITGCLSSSPLLTEGMEKNYEAMSSRLLPIKPAADWQGYLVNRCESIKRNLYWIINLFSTRKWALEDQVYVKISRKIKEIDEVLNFKPDVNLGEITSDYERRQQLANILVLMLKCIQQASSIETESKALFLKQHNKLVELGNLSWDGKNDRFSELISAQERYNELSKLVQKEQKKFLDLHAYIAEKQAINLAELLNARRRLPIQT